MKNVKYLIIGAGPCGIGAAYSFKEQGINDFLLLEKESVPGGLARSIRDGQGFLWDIGGHVQFSHYEKFDEAMSVAMPPEKWLEHERNSAVWLKDRFIPYPFQNYLSYLSKSDREWCLQTLEKYREENDGKDFESWIYKTFGEGIAKLFMLPYNFKVWAYPASLMSASWISERVSAPNADKIRKLAENPEQASWGPNQTFNFPLEGGTGAIWQSLATQVAAGHVHYSQTLAKIDPEKKEVTTKEGEKYHYEHLLSTIPLNILTQAFPKELQVLQQESQKLLYSTTHIVGLGIRGKPKQHIADKTWMYFPESTSPFYRVTVFSNYSPNNTPTSDTYSLMTEISESSYKPVNEESLVDQVIEGAVQAELIDRTDIDKIVSRFTFKAPLGYPTPSLERDAILQFVIPALEKKDIYSRGRFGGWKYEVSNQDHTFMQGYEWANRLTLGTEEETFTIK